MLGNRSSYSLTNFFIASVRQRMNFMYFQDDIKVMPNLTINAGLRYELATPQYEANNKLANFDPGTKTLLQAKSGSIYNRALVNMPLNNVGPRFGLSYSVRPNTVIRSGYGISYTQFNRAGGENNLTYNGPNVVNATITNAPPTLTSRCTNDTQDQTLCFRQTQQGYSVNLTAPAAFNPAFVTSRYIPKDTKTGYVQSYFTGCAASVARPGCDGCGLCRKQGNASADPCGLQPVGFLHGGIGDELHPVVEGSASHSYLWGHRDCMGRRNLEL